MLCSSPPPPPAPTLGQQCGTVKESERRALPCPGHRGQEIGCLIEWRCSDEGGKSPIDAIRDDHGPGAG